MITDLPSRPKIRESEREACVCILQATKPETIVDAAERIMKEIVTEQPFKPPTYAPDPEV